MSLGPPSCPWSCPWSWAPSHCTPSAAAPPAWAASTAWTWSGSAWPSPSSPSVSTASDSPSCNCGFLHCKPEAFRFWDSFYRIVRTTRFFGLGLHRRLFSACLRWPCFPPSAPPDYCAIVSDEEAERNMSPPLIEEDFTGVLQRPFFAYVQEFRYRPPPFYSEVSHWASTLPEVWEGVLPVVPNISRCSPSCRSYLSWILRMECTWFEIKNRKHELKNLKHRWRHLRHNFVVYLILIFRMYDFK